MRTVTGLFDDYGDAREAVSDLEAAGVPSDDISIVANNIGDRYSTDGSNAAEGAGTGAGLGAAGGGVVGLLTGLGLMAIPGVGPVVAAGWLASTAAGAAAGAIAGGAAGGLIGALTESGVDEEDAHVYAEGVRRGHVGHSKGRGQCCTTSRSDPETAENRGPSGPQEHLCPGRMVAI